MRAVLVGVMFGGLTSFLVAAPQQDTKAARTGMTQRLQSQFVMAKFNGFELKQPGAMYVVKKDGIAALPGSGVGFSVTSFGSNYKDGKIRRDVLSSLAFTNKEGLRNLAVGEGVYVLKVQANESNVILDVQSCGQCDPAAPDPAPVRATVTFGFKKGFTETVSVEQVLATIGEVFAPANPEPVAQPVTGNLPPGEGAAPPVESAPVQPPVNNAEPEKEPARIELGQTIEQVQTMLGKPEKIVDLGSKKIYVYKDLKITFLDGVVSDVQ